MFLLPWNLFILLKILLLLLTTPFYGNPSIVDTLSEVSCIKRCPHCRYKKACSPLRGWNKGTDRAIYAVEP